jgi:hypothetical protein
MPDTDTVTTTTTKTVSITGGAHLVGHRKHHRSKKNKKQVPDEKPQKGGACDITVTKAEALAAMMPQPQGYQSPSPLTPGASYKTAFDPLLTPTQKDQPVPVSVSSGPISSDLIPRQSGGKVKLTKAQEPKKVQLHPKKDGKSSAHSKDLKKKKTRKIVLGLVSLKKRQTRAHKVSQKIKEMPLEKLRAHLIAKQLIKPTSKAPESILRQIAADTQIVNGGI